MNLFKIATLWEIEHSSSTNRWGSFSVSNMARTPVEYSGGTGGSHIGKPLPMLEEGLQGIFALSMTWRQWDSLVGSLNYVAEGLPLRRLCFRRPILEDRKLFASARGLASGFSQFSSGS